jgi:hypothetical protein
MEQAPRARVPKPDEAAVNVGRKGHRVKTVWEPAGVKAGDPAKVAAGVRVKPEAPDRAVAGSHNK